MKRCAIALASAMLLVACYQEVPPVSPATASSAATATTAAFQDQVIVKTIAKLIKVRESEIKSTTRFADLKMDDLDFVELIMELEDELKISIPDERLEGKAKSTAALLQMTVHELGDIVRDCIAHPVPHTQPVR